MSLARSIKPLFQGFSKLTREERFLRLKDMGALSAEDINFLQTGGVEDLVFAEKFIENSIGYFELPLGVATYFKIDNKDYVIPLAVEETSIIAALSKTAKWISEQGEITTSITGTGILGQIQLQHVKNFSQLQQIFLQHKNELIKLVNREVLSSMVKRGGGVIDMQLRHIPYHDGKDMAVIHVTMESCDAMGANAINQALEFLKNPLEELSNEKVSLCILSNLNDQKLTRAEVKIKGVAKSLGKRIEEAAFFATIDPYRAATHNKGIMNGIDALAIATGNDWRAIEAGMHAYAARSGQYRALSQWRYEAKTLIGVLEAPLIVGTVGGVTSLHPTAKLCLSMLKTKSANELSRVMAAVGLVQNLGALRALCTDGIIKGHMKLHIDNLVLVTGANDKERPLLTAKLQSYLLSSQRVSLSHAEQFLSEIRQNLSVS
ncbi:MAG: hydroxymethylglutaryl-CoA reductase, degradative [Legionellales bacterium RIFCSPHIGHO2_12_FULL_37_14]|nr:MAG: hydroxymethylglutaryl-CoA reductase, degradative [Legionellales bacterium RIFCSPHIGHO2_12_FULL_37_14]